MKTIDSIWLKAHARKEDMIIDVTYAPYRGQKPGGRDTAGHRFVPGVSNFHENELWKRRPPVVFEFHNFKHDWKKPLEFRGELLRDKKTKDFVVWEDFKGRHTKIKLDDTPRGRQLYKAAQKGKLYVSMAIDPEVFQVAPDGTILDCGITGISLVENEGGMRPRNMYATATPAMVKAALLPRGSETQRSKDEGASEQRGQSSLQLNYGGSMLTKEQIQALRDSGMSEADIQKLLKAERPGSSVDDVLDSDAFANRISSILDERDKKLKAEAEAEEKRQKEMQEEIDKQVKEQLKAEKEKWHRELPPEKKKFFEAGGEYDKSIPEGDKISDYLKAVFLGDDKKLREWGYSEGEVDARTRALLKAQGFESAEGYSGGFFLKENQWDRIFGYAIQNDWLLSRVMEIPNVTSIGASFPYIEDWDRSTPETTGYYGGVVFYPVDEGEAPSMSSITVSDGKVEVHGVACAMVLSKTWLEDTGGSYEAWITKTLQDAAKLYLGRLIYSAGTGVGTPIGMFNSANPILESLARNTASHVYKADFDGLLAKIDEGVLMSNDGNPDPTLMFAVNRSVDSELDSFVDSSSNNHWIDPIKGLHYRSVRVYKGVPVWYTPWNAAMGTEKDVTILCPSKYLFAPSKQFSIEVFREIRGLNRQVIPFGYMRVGGRPWAPTKVTAEDGTTQTHFAYLTDAE